MAVVKQLNDLLCGSKTGIFVFSCFSSPATFDGKQHLLSLPVVNSIDYVLRFLKKLCRSLHCENLFSDQPITQHSLGSYQSDGSLESLHSRLLF